MPIYEFECLKCGHVTSFLESSRSTDAHACEKCGSEKTEKLFSSFAPMSASPSAPPEGACSQCPSQFSCPNQH